MATISYADIAKRQNVSVFVDRVNSGGFQLTNDSSPSYPSTGKVEMKLGTNTITFDSTRAFNEEALQMFLSTKKSNDSLKVELNVDGTKTMYLTSALYKDKEFGGVASKSSGQGSERQELGLINAINEAANKNSNLNIRQISITETIKSASKNEGLSQVRQEPYIDVYIETDKNKYGISCKGTSAPSLAGGGTAGLKVVVPQLLSKLYKTIEYYLKTDLKLKDQQITDASLIPDLFIAIPNSYVKDILRGNEMMGGPIDYMYVGPMDVTSSINSGQITFNGNFYGITEYMRKIGTFYFRIRKRDLDPDNSIKIELTRKNKEGYNMLFTSPSKGKNNLRIVITDSVPSTGKVLQLR